MTKLETITAEDLQNRTYEPTHFLVDELIPEGLHILAGAPKIGKSWLALWLCLCVAQGQALWNFATTQGEAAPHKIRRTAWETMRCIFHIFVLDNSPKSYYNPQV